MRLGYLEHELLQPIDATEVQEEEAPEVRRSDGEGHLLGDGLQLQVEQVARDVDREVLEVKVGDHHERLERALHAELVDRLAERVRRYNTVLRKDAVVDEEVECLSHESRGGIEWRGIEGVESVESKVDNS